MPLLRITRQYYDVVVVVFVKVEPPFFLLFKRFLGIQPVQGFIFRCDVRSTVGQNQVVLRNLIMHFPMSAGVSEQMSKQMSAVERMRKVSCAKQAKK